jgi:acyl-CoA synthetase (AMP-forming)/AMP-acid ligase II
MNIALLLEMSAGAAPDRVALSCDGRDWSYGELYQAACSAAAYIHSTGAEMVGLLDESSAASLIALFGAALAGKAYCPLNYRLPDLDLTALIERMTPALMIGDAERLARLTAQNPILSRDEFLGICTRPADSAAVEADAGDGVAVQLFTSGTTAAPKAAILSHHNLSSYIFGTVEFAAAEESEATLVSVPPYHIAGIAAMLSSIYAQRHILLLPSFSPEAWLDLAAHYRATNAFVVPTMLSRIVEAMDAGKCVDISSLASIAYGGGKMPLQLIERALQLFPNTGFTNAYGLTETSSTIALLGPEEHREALQSQDPLIHRRLTSVGRPLPTVELEIRDEEGRVLGAEEVGEIYVRGPQVSGQYRERSALDSDGWFPTRDAGFVDAEGYLFLNGRADDVIVRGGENISPGEIEDVIIAHPAVADVAAVPVADAEWGEAIGLAIVLKAEAQNLCEEDVRDLVRARLRSSRVPDKIRFFPELPYNELGKLLRREVRQMLAGG